MRNPATVQAPSATLPPTSVVDPSTQPVTPAAETDADSGGTRHPFRVLGNRAVMVPLACVAALLVGFGTVTAVLRIGDEPAQSDVKTPPTTAAGVPAPPSNAAPVNPVPRAPTPSAPAVEAEPPPQLPQPSPAQTAPARTAPTPEPPPAPPSSAPPTTTPQTTTPSTTAPSQ